MAIAKAVLSIFGFLLFAHRECLPHPTLQTDGGWYFDFPNAPNSVHYVLAAVNMAASSSVDASILVATTGTPVFVYNLQPTIAVPIRRTSGFCCNREVTIYQE